MLSLGTNRDFVETTQQSPEDSEPVAMTDGSPNFLASGNPPGVAGGAAESSTTPFTHGTLDIQLLDNESLE